ncbi:FdhE protein [Evansella caseinilytica]|uniref:FdhE protein n=1 Tax=Evansella caseinilytica TaxID=1503961 RepID=A0A1H3RWN2_9BACI|nr:formate dehydrogenase accessory protein FdhE [Evansella caseinilytica]SDZ30037.1 FdhE protein [Evansella caseinilytica]
MEQHVVSEEYIALQAGIIHEQNKIRGSLEKNINLHISKSELNHEKPVLPQLKVNPVPLHLYRTVVKTIASYIQREIPEPAGDLLHVVEELDEEELRLWLKGSITFNTNYFADFAAKKGIEPWLPHFLAEQALRPFMHFLGKVCQPFIDEMDVMGICPCCGEPPRIAKLKGDHPSVFCCPRCETEWQQKRHACAHCGDDHPDNLFYIAIEEDETTYMEVCKRCRNYIKIVKEGSACQHKQAALIDLETIHLDFVAYEEGYGEERQ